MGISNDIKPKKVYYPVRHQHRGSKSRSDHFEVPEEDELITETPLEEIPKEPASPQIKRTPVEKFDEEKKPESHASHTKEEIEDDFFSDYNQPEVNKPEITPKARIIRLSPGRIVSMLFIVLVVVLVSQNFKSIKGAIIPEQKKTITQSKDQNNSNLTQYTSESNDNANTSLNQNTNINPTIVANTNTNENQTPPPEVTTASEIDKSTISLKVLNGSGITGAGNIVSKQLQEKGFTVSSTGNAKSFSYSQTYVYYKTGKQAEADLITNSITGKTMTVEQNDNAVGTADVVVVVGKK